MNTEMSIWIWCFGIIVSSYVETMDRKNLIKTVPSVMSYKDKDTVVKNGQAIIECTCVQATNINRIEYNHDKLYSIATKVGKDPRYKLTDRSACTRVRKLHLDKRGKRGGKRLKHHTHKLGFIQDGANSSNLVHIKTDTRENMRNTI